MHLAPQLLIEFMKRNSGKMHSGLQNRGLSRSSEASDYLPETLQACSDSNQHNGLCKGRQLS